MSKNDHRKNEEEVAVGAPTVEETPAAVEVPEPAAVDDVSGTPKTYKGHEILGDIVKVEMHGTEFNSFRDVNGVQYLVSDEDMASGSGK